MDVRSKESCPGESKAYSFETLSGGDSPNSFLLDSSLVVFPLFSVRSSVFVATGTQFSLWTLKHAREQLPSVQSSEKNILRNQTLRTLVLCLWDISILAVHRNLTSRQFCGSRQQQKLPETSVRPRRRISGIHLKAISILRSLGRNSQNGVIGQTTISF